MSTFDIGFVGLAGSGKDTAAEAVTPLGWRTASFAGPLKTLCRSLGWYGLKDEKGRRLLQEVGCALRHFDPGYWVDQAEILHPAGGPTRYVWTDVRFQNEADMIKARGGILIKVIRLSLERSEAHLHESETSTESINCDYYVENDGTKEELHDQVLAVVLRHAQLIACTELL